MAKSKAITIHRDNLRSALSFVRKLSVTATKALEALPYREALKPISEFEEAAEEVAAELGVDITGWCIGCSEPIFEDERFTYHEEGFECAACRPDEEVVPPDEGEA